MHKSAASIKTRLLTCPVTLAEKGVTFCRPFSHKPPHRTPNLGSCINERAPGVSRGRGAVGLMRTTRVAEVPRASWSRQKRPRQLQETSAAPRTPAGNTSVLLASTAANPPHPASSTSSEPGAPSGPHSLLQFERCQRRLPIGRRRRAVPPRGLKPLVAWQLGDQHRGVAGAHQVRHA